MKIIVEIIKRLELGLKCMDSEMQVTFDAYEISDMIEQLKKVVKNEGE